MRLILNIVNDQLNIALEKTAGETDDDLKVMTVLRALCTAILACIDTEGETIEQKKDYFEKVMQMLLDDTPLERNTWN